MLHWADDGVQIIIRKPKEMEARVLPLVYKQSKFASFSRQLNIYGFMRKVSMRHVDMARDNDVSVWTHYELNRYSSADKLMSYKRRVGPRHYVRKNGAPAPPAITKMEFPVGVNAGQPVITYEEIAPPAAFKSPQVAFANETPGMPSCHALAFGSPYSVSTNTLSDQSLPETPASVSPVRPIRTHGKSHKMSAGTLPMPSFHERNSSLTYASVGRSVPQNSMASQHSMYPMLGGCAKRVKAENMVDGYSSSDMVQGGLWQSLLGNAGVPHVPQTANNAQFSSCLFPAIGSSGHPLAPASFQPHSGSSYTRPAGTHGQSINPPMMNQMQYVRTFAPPMAQQQQIVYPSGPYAPAESTTHPAPQPSRTMSNSSGSSSMLMTPPRLEAIHIKTEQVDQSPVFGSFSLSLGHASQGIHSGAETGGMDEAIRMQQADQAAENQRNLTIAGNQAFASFLHDMASSPAPSAEVRATPAIAMHGSTPRPDEEDDSTHRMFVNSFETIRPQVAKPTSSCGMQVVIADIETEDDMRYLEETFDSRQIKLADDKAQRHDVSDENVMRKNERLLDEGDRDDGLSRRGGSCMDKTVRQGHDDSASGEFDAWMVVHHAMDD
ncbi:hypothetical protein QFC22_006160 [Naganishia vaughanmartiniae]|uniref:Uncharacterized protein n=1 Tax=Naganishia vaughanmartiniae TaxID=1424756 RepID=A0ACC2WMV2_9TREE|nr:hypothetical protein QFC22_006160 [Naganishia vaughanmartiniae]